MNEPKGELRATITVKRAATGKEETYELIGRCGEEEAVALGAKIAPRAHGASGGLVGPGAAVKKQIAEALHRATLGYMEWLGALRYAVTHSTASRDAATNAVVDQLDGAGSKLCFRISAAGAIAATLTCATPAFGASSSGTATAGAIASDTNAAGNASPVSHATLQTSGDVVAITCQVAASGSDVNLTNGLTVASGDTVSCSSLTYTALSA